MNGGESGVGLEPSLAEARASQGRLSMICKQEMVEM